MSRILRLSAMLILSAPCSAHGDKPSDREARFSSTASFARNSYAVSFPVQGHDSRINISCYSLDDASREKFARERGSDPVADLSCYVKDTQRVNEFTMLGLSGESLQFTPAFFWFAQISKCKPKAFHMDAWLRGMKISFEFSGIDLAAKTARMEITVTRMAAANNDRLTEKTHRAYCA